MTRLTTFPRLAVVSFMLLVSSACSYSIHQVHVSDFAPGAAKNKGKIVRAEAERRIILGFDDNTEYVDSAYRSLMSKCKDGDLQGITTQFSTAHGFFSWTNKIFMQGLCVKG